MASKAFDALRGVGARPADVSLEVLRGALDERQRQDGTEGGARDAATSVDKALALLGAFNSSHRLMGVSELARRAELPKSTAHRLLSVLVRWNLVARDGMSYTVGPKLVELAALTSEQTLRNTALPYLIDLHKLTNETVHLAILDGWDVLFIEKLFGHNSGTWPSQVGGRFPASCSALGKVMLAHGSAVEPTIPTNISKLPRFTTNSIADPRHLHAELAKIRQDGTALDRQEAAVGLTCIATPIVGPFGELVGAISVSGPIRRFRPIMVSAEIRAAATGINRAYSRQLAASDEARCRRDDVASRMKGA